MNSAENGILLTKNVVHSNTSDLESVSIPENFTSENNLQHETDATSNCSTETMDNTCGMDTSDLVLVSNPEYFASENNPQHETDATRNSSTESMDNTCDTDTSQSQSEQPIYSQVNKKPVDYNDDSMLKRGTRFNANTFQTEKRLSKLFNNN